MASTNDTSHAGKHAKAPEPNKGKKRGGVVALWIALAVCIVAAACGIGYMAWQQHQLDEAAKQQAEAPVPETPDESQAEEEADPRVDNPINFDELQQKNAEIYAWLYIPGTNVNLPVLQSVTNDTYYLDHNADGEYAIEGAAFSQSMNSKDFTDPVTLIYGHQTGSGAIFTTLHRFEDPDFFNANSEMYIYTPGHILTYEIIAAYQYDDRHIMNSYDFSDPTVRQQYFASVLAPDSMLVNERAGATLTADSKIVQLSTCMDAITRDNTRYIVTGVLTNDQPTY